MKKRQTMGKMMRDRSSRSAGRRAAEEGRAAARSAGGRERGERARACGHPCGRRRVDGGGACARGRRGAHARGRVARAAPRRRSRASAVPSGSRAGTGGREPGERRASLNGMHAAEPSRRALLDGLIARFPHIRRRRSSRRNIARAGIAFEDSALTDNLDGEVKPKSYFIFSFDQQPLAQLGEAAHRRPPEEVALSGGPYALRRTIVSVRVNPDSPYRVARGEGGGLAVISRGSGARRGHATAVPEYYRHQLANGKTVMETAPTIQWGYLVYLTVLRL